MQNNTNQNNKPKRNSSEYYTEQIAKLKEKHNEVKKKEKILIAKNKQKNETTYAFAFSRFFITKYLISEDKTLQYIFNNSFENSNFMIDFLLDNKKNNGV